MSAPVAWITGDVHSTEIIDAPEAVAYARSNLRDRHVMELLVRKRRPVVTLYAAQSQKRLRSLELLRR